ncbi:MAG: TRAP transporter substrate-binding protein DctP [Chloroflexi bacterium]|nr:TRAP transporter substrate-binding protein DctP [Chloroflexota bacterium]
MKRKGVLIVCLLLILVLGVALACRAPTPAAKPTPAPTVTTTATATVTAPPTTVTATPAPAPTVTVTATPATAQPIVVRALRPWPWDVADLTSYREFFKRINDKAEGKLVIKDMGGTEVFPAAEQLEPLRLGKVDLLVTSSGYIAGAFPEINVNMFRFGASDIQLRAAGYFDILDKFARQKLGVAVLGLPYWSQHHMYLAKNPVKSIYDLKGYKLRVVADQQPIVEKIAAAVVIPVGETYSALEKGVVDGIAFPNKGLTDWGFETVLKYRFDPPIILGHSLTVLVNAKFFDALPKELQALMKNTMAEMDKWAEDALIAVTKKEVDMITKLGMKSIRMSDEEWKKTQEWAWEGGFLERLKKMPPESANEIKAIIGKFYPPSPPTGYPTFPAWTP